VDSLGQEVTGVIRKVDPYALVGDSLYYEYEYAIDGLQLAEPVFLSVTAFDFGNPAADLAPLESSPMANRSENVYP
jgi:hypothetical protein